MQNAEPTGRASPAYQPAADALRVMQEARSLAKLCDGFWTDLTRCEEEGDSVAFAIDSDVVTLYTSPARMAIYGRTFSDHPSAIAADTASLLGDFIVRRMRSCIGMAAGGYSQPDPGLIVFPPHAKELQRVALAIQHNAMSKSGRYAAVHPKMAAELDDILQKAHPSAHEHERAAELLRQQGWLMDSKSPTTANQEHQRLEMLPEARFVPLRSHPWFSDQDGKLLLPPRFPQPLLPHVRLEGDCATLVQRVDWWYERLLTVHLANFNNAPKEYKRLNLLADAEVLAQLEWVNRALAASSMPNRRIILVTGTPTILLAAAEVPSPVDGFGTFSEAFLRNPLAFLGAKDLAPAPDSSDAPAGDRIPFESIELHLADWLSVFFPKASFQRRFDNKIATRSTGSTVGLKFTPPSDEELLALWTGSDAGKDGLRTLEGFPANQLSTLGESLHKVAERAWGELAAKFNRDAWDEIRRRWANVSEDPAERISMVLRQRELNGIDRVFGLVAQVGALQLLAPHLKMKGLPALRFDEEFEPAQAQSVLLCDKLFTPVSPDRRFDLAAMERAVNQTDDSGYHARVLRAYVFACAGLWFQVRPLCLSALLTVKAIANKRPDDRRTGREAAYLLAVAERRLASNAEGLKNARTALRDARLRDHLPSDLRFDSEELAQTVTEIQLALYGDIAKPKGVDWQVLIDQALKYTVAAQVEKPSIIRRWIIRQSVTNGLLLCLVAKDMRVRSSVITGRARELTKALTAEGLAPVLPTDGAEITQKYADGVSDMVWLVATAVFDADIERARAARAQLEAEYGKPAEEQASLDESARSAAPAEEQTTFVESARSAALLRLAGVERS